MFREMLVRITGTKTLTVENYKNILDYKGNLILIQGKTEDLKITGENFLIEYFTQDSMQITGSIEKIEFQITGKKANKR